MNTSELYIEPVLVGFLVLAVAALLWIPDFGLLGQVAMDKLPEGIAVGAALVGLAYLIGVPADRLIDSALSVIERHARARFAIQNRNRPVIDDWFPEDKYRIAVMLKSEDGPADWLAYVRTRLRLARAVTFALPALTYALIVAVIHARRLPPLEGFGAVGDPMTWMVPLAYLLMPFLGFILRSRGSTEPPARWHPPRTDKGKELTAYAEHRNLSEGSGDGGHLSVLVLDLTLQPFPIAAAMLLLASLTVGACMLGALGAVLAVAGALMTWGAFYAWWRSYFTFFTYLRLFGQRFVEQKP